MTDEPIGGEQLEDSLLAADDTPTAASSPPELESPDFSVTDVVSAIEKERDEMRDIALRLQADFENYRKRALKQQTETMERANESLVQKLLPVLDTIDLAKAHDPADSVEQISAALLEVLTREGLERIAAVNEPFDPTQHSAVAHEPGDGEPRVSEELRAGYRWKGRVLRPAMVKVIG